MILFRQTVAVVALLFSLISLVGWMAFLVFAGNVGFSSYGGNWVTRLSGGAV
jgi:hypothetical protein